MEELVDAELYGNVSCAEKLYDESVFAAVVLAKTALNPLVLEHLIASLFYFARARVGP